MATPFQPRDYLSLPSVDVPTSITFSFKIMAAAPKKPPASIKKALAGVETAGGALQAAWTDVDRAGPSDRRPTDHSADVAWAALRDRVETYSRLPADRYPYVERARWIDASLFAGGMSFLNAEYEVQWAEMHKRVQRMHEEDLMADLEYICGTDHVAEAMRTYEEYGRMLGVHAPGRQESTPPSLAELQRALVGAAVDYAIQVIAWHQDGTDDVKATARAALLPYEELRQNAAKARKGTGESEGDVPVIDGQGQGHGQSQGQSQSKKPGEATVETKGEGKTQSGPTAPVPSTGEGMTGSEAKNG